MIIRGRYRDQPFIITTEGGDIIGAGPGWNLLAPQLDVSWGELVPEPQMEDIELVRGDDAALAAWLRRQPDIRFRSAEGVPALPEIPAGAIA